MEEKKTTVIIYTSPFCGMCHSLMDWLNQIGIMYEEKNIEDEATMSELMELTDGEFDGTPVTAINGQIVEGFDRPKILELLKRAGLKP